ncbi:DUF6668 family protein [Streptomyces sp. NPDC001492]
MAGDAPNPWLTQPRSDVQSVPTVHPVAPANDYAVPLRPQPGSVPQPPQGLPIAPTGTPPQGGWAWLGCHGGAGVTTLQQALPGGYDANRAWPAAVAGWRCPVVLVCRSHVSGLTAAQTAARQWASGAVPGVELLGLVVVADAPGSLPRPLKDLAKLVSGGYPRTWSVPWLDAWRLGEPPAAHLPRQLASLQRELADRSNPTGRLHHG